jgi:hypothetical protein
MRVGLFRMSIIRELLQNNGKKVMIYDKDKNFSQYMKLGYCAKVKTQPFLM